MSADTSVSVENLRAFERDLLYAVRALERDSENSPRGLGIKSRFEREYTAVKRARYTSEVTQITNSTLAATKPIKNTSNSRVHRWTDVLDIRLLLVFVERTRVELSREILLACFADNVVASLFALNKAVVHESRQSPIHFVTASVDVLGDNGGGENQTRRFERFQNALVGGELHPIAGSAHDEDHQSLIFTGVDMSSLAQRLLRNDTTIDVKIYVPCVRTCSLTGTIRGPVTPRWVHHRKQADRCLGHRVRETLPYPAYGSMYANTTAGLETPARPADSLAITHSTGGVGA
nr:hypothetical protein [Halorussus salinus]